MSLDIRTQLSVLAPESLSEEQAAVHSRIHSALLIFGTALAVTLVAALSVMLHVS